AAQEDRTGWHPCGPHESGQCVSRRAGQPVDTRARRWCRVVGDRGLTGGCGTGGGCGGHVGIARQHPTTAHRTSAGRPVEPVVGQRDRGARRRGTCAHRRRPRPGGSHRAHRRRRGAGRLPRGGVHRLRSGRVLPDGGVVTGDQDVRPRGRLGGRRTHVDGLRGHHRGGGTGDGRGGGSRGRHRGRAQYGDRQGGSAHHGGGVPAGRTDGEEPAVGGRVRGGGGGSRTAAWGAAVGQSGNGGEPGRGVGAGGIAVPRQRGPVGGGTTTGRYGRPRAQPTQYRGPRPGGRAVFRQDRHAHRGQAHRERDRQRHGAVAGGRPDRTAAVGVGRGVACHPALPGRREVAPRHRQG